VAGARPHLRYSATLTPGTLDECRWLSENALHEMCGTEVSEGPDILREVSPWPDDGNWTGLDLELAGGTPEWFSAPRQFSVAVQFKCLTKSPKYGPITGLYLSVALGPAHLTQRTYCALAVPAEEGQSFIVQFDDYTMTDATLPTTIGVEAGYYAQGAPQGMGWSRRFNDWHR
jgi:hypothetical protein